MAGLPERLRQSVRARLGREAGEAAALRERARRSVGAALTGAAGDLAHVRAHVRSLSPQATLDRGYAVVQRDDGLVVRDPAEARGRLRVRVARGEFAAVAAEDEHGA